MNKSVYSDKRYSNYQNNSGEKGGHEQHGGTNRPSQRSEQRGDVDKSIYPDKRYSHYQNNSEEKGGQGAKTPVSAREKVDNRPSWMSSSERPLFPKDAARRPSVFVINAVCLNA